jgi:hypothetical protein
LTIRTFRHMKWHFVGIKKRTSKDNYAIKTSWAPNLKLWVFLLSSFFFNFAFCWLYLIYNRSKKNIMFIWKAFEFNMHRSKFSVVSFDLKYCNIIFMLILKNKLMELQSSLVFRRHIFQATSYIHFGKIFFTSFITK